MPSTSANWAFLTNHARVLLCIAHNPEIRLRDIAARIDITERATQRIVSELVDTGYVTRKRVGRRNRYKVHNGKPMRLPEVEQTEIGDLLGVLMKDRNGSRAAS